jgi:hypothetical protein
MMFEVISNIRTTLSLYICVHIRHTMPINTHTHFVLVIMILEFELSASYLLGHHSTTWAMHPNIFALVIFWIGFLCFGLRPHLDHNPPSDASHITGIMCVHYLTPRFVGWDEVLLTFFPDCPLITILLISTSWILGSIWYHCVWQCIQFLYTYMS